MEYITFFEDLLANDLITPIWKEILSILSKEIENNPASEEKKNDYLILISILFALNKDGNICMSLDKEKLLEKWNKKLDGQEVLLKGMNRFKSEEFVTAKEKSNEVINRSLDDISVDNLPELICSEENPHKYFEIDNDWLYLRKHNVARKSLLKSIDRLFNKTFAGGSFDYKQHVKSSFKLTDGQENVVTTGLEKNLVITGGPGTGKTTSILFLLLGLLVSGQYKEVYLLAPSGKAASRMKDSIKGGLEVLTDEFREDNKEIVDRVENLRRFTIHSALYIDKDTGAFSFNENQQLSDKSIYIIDVASMIDVCLFASLLSAIPDDARVFIMGDKNQLPSVEAGAVFGELIVKPSLLQNGNVCELGEAVRFKEGTAIYNLANAINKDDIQLPQIEWKDEILKVEENTENIANPVYFYANPLSDTNIKQKDIVKNAALNFGEKYFKGLQDEFSNLDPNHPEEFKDKFKNSSKRAVILCAENEGVRGIKTINALIKSKFIDKTKPTTCEGYYPGELMMVLKNDKLLDLANGDSGILVTFDKDNTLYFMVEKDSEIVKTEGKVDGKIFKLGGYLFYPFNKITGEDIDDAYAITIHKSQGSDYQNILVILPDAVGHPLLNRQIVYTAITRTKGDTYILSNQDRLEEAKRTVIIRDTNIK